LLSFSVLKICFPYIVTFLTDSFTTQYAYAANSSADSISYSKMFMDVALTMLLIILPVALATIFGSVLATGAQTRFLFSGEALKPKFGRLNPLKGFQNMFSLKSLVELLKNLIKVIVICYLMYSFFVNRLSDFVMTLSLDVAVSASVLLEAIMSLVYNISLGFVALAAVDYMFQRYDYEKNIRMTKQEVKEEYKQLEGDPQVKGKIKERQRRFALSRMMQAVPTADVVIRNPTHFAVALRYDIDNDIAPVVVAKGSDDIALRIVQVAELNDVYVTEQAELTRAIYAAADLGQMIPLEFYAAVAEVLALVYQIKEKQI
jgi:flagellar biosynthetic protein FlhB